MDEDGENEIIAHLSDVKVFPDDNEWPWSLTELDVPGASLGNREPNACNVKELKFWLKCRGMSSTGFIKHQLVELVSVCRSNNDLMSQPILDPDYPQYTDRKILSLRQSGQLSEEIVHVFPSLRPPLFPPVSTHWLPIKDVTSNIQAYLQLYNHKTIFQYYSVMANIRDSEFHNRALTRGAQHHSAGHVKSLVLNLQDPIVDENIKEKGLYVKADVHASMKDVKYSTKISLYQYEPHTYKIKVRYAQCTCVAGQAGICGHIAATLYQLIDARLKIVKKDVKTTENLVSCTSLPNAWRGKTAKRKQTIEKIPVEQYNYEKFDLTGKKQQRNKKMNIMDFDPSPNQVVNADLRLNAFVGKFETGNNSRIFSLWNYKVNNQC